MRKFEDYVVQKQIDGSQNLAALANQRASLIDAITSDYKTDIMGGLLLTTLLHMRGMEADGSLKTNSGISGLTNEVNPVRFWAGSTFENRNNAPFRVRHDGSVVMKQANIEGNVKALSGKIGGFTINETGLTNTPFGSDNDAYIIFRDNPHNIFAGIGTNVLPATSGAAAAARFENHDDTGWSLNTNLASYFSAKNGGKNYAIYIGAGVIGGFALDVRREGNFTQDMVPSHTDCIISCYNTEDRTIVLPSVTAEGMTGKLYFIRANNNRKVQVKGNILEGVNVRDNVIVENGVTGLFVNDGQFWLYMRL